MYGKRLTQEKKKERKKIVKEKEKRRKKEAPKNSYVTQFRVH